MKWDVSILNEMRLKYYWMKWDLSIIEWNETQVYWMKWDSNKYIDL